MAASMPGPTASTARFESIEGRDFARGRAETARLLGRAKVCLPHYDRVAGHLPV